MSSLGNRYALTALRDKRASLAGEVASSKKQLAWREEQLIHLDHTLMLLDPSHDGSKIPPKRAAKRVKLFRQGELGCIIRDALREAKGPITAPQIVDRLMALMGYSREVRPTLGPRVRGNLSYLLRRGVVKKQNTGEGVLWELSDTLD